MATADDVLCPPCPRRRSPNRWRWNAGLAPGGAARLTVLPHEAVLLNSLRRLLAVVPQTEHTLAKWAGGPAAQPPTPSGSVHPASPATQGTRGRRVFVARKYPHPHVPMPFGSVHPASPATQGMRGRGSLSH